MKLLVLAGAFALLFCVPAFAQQRPRPNARPDTPPCAGTLATIRFSAVKPGQWRQFAGAVAAHRAWYQRHRSPNTVTLSRVLARGGYSEREAVTITWFRDAGRAAPARDADWNRFVAAYQASSNVTEERRVCLPRV